MRTAIRRQQFRERSFCIPSLEVRSRAWHGQITLKSPGEVTSEYGAHEEKPLNQWIGLRENLQESPILNGKIYGFL